MALLSRDVVTLILTGNKVESVGVQRELTISYHDVSANCILPRFSHIYTSRSTHYSAEVVHDAI